jgi:hypothetical protein
MTNKTAAEDATSMTSTASMISAAADSRIPRSLTELPEAIVIPENAVCVFVSGSLVAGWGHAASDVDLYVVTDLPVTIEPTALLDLGLSPEPIPIVTAYGREGQRYDIEYWTIQQVQTMLDAVAPGKDPGSRPSSSDVDCFYRISVGVALTGTAWLRRAQDQLAASALPVLLANHEFSAVDGSIEDAVGLMEVGDRESAVLAARQALGHAVDGYLAARGSFSPQEKWRYRKLTELPDPPLSPEEYWDLETMRDLDPADPQAWITRVIDVCNSLIMEVDFS